MPIFYEITSRTGKKNYLFGTMHLNDERINTLPLEVKSAFETASLLCVEVDVTQSNMAAKQQALLDWNHKFGSQHQAWIKQPGNLEEVTGKLTQRFSTHSKADLEKLVKTYPPTYVISFLENHLQTNNSKNTLDHNFILRAKKRRLTVYGLETASLQIQFLFGYKLTYAEQRQLFDIRLRHQSSKVQKDRLIEAYCYGNFINMEKFVLSYDESERPLMQRYFVDLMITERDKKMVAALEWPFLTGNAFVAVGAAHLAGIVTLLEHKGYTIKSVPITKRIFPVLDYYERNHLEMQKTGTAFILAPVLVAVALFISSQILEAILLSIVAALLAYAFLKAILLAYQYGVEPRLTLQPIKSTQAKVSGVSMFRQLRPIARNGEVEEVFDYLDRYAPILFLDIEASENVKKIINYSKPHYQLKEAIGSMYRSNGSISQQDLDDLLAFDADPRNFARTSEDRITLN